MNFGIINGLTSKKNFQRNERVVILKDIKIIKLLKIYVKKESSIN